MNEANSAYPPDRSGKADPMLTALSKSQIYREYNVALEEATGRLLDFNAPGLKVSRP